jgi:hypothetical protein
MFKTAGGAYKCHNKLPVRTLLHDSLAGTGPIYLIAEPLVELPVWATCAWRPTDVL